MAMAFPNQLVANLSTMFDDDDYETRFDKAKKIGFTAVEAKSLYHLDLEKVIDMKKASGLEVALINSPSSGDIDYYDGKAVGLACIAGQEIEFSKSIKKAALYANGLGCHKIHVLAGLKQDNLTEADLMTSYVRNIQCAVEYLEEYNITTLIEPVCFHVQEKYFMDTFDKAVDVITEIKSKNLQMLLDVYHLRKLNTDVEAGLRKFVQYAGHIQVSQDPGRHEPFYPGEIDYKKVFQILNELKYTGQIGLEYTPSDPVNGFKWLEEYNLV